MTKIDFSEFHPLDHRLWERRCWSRQIQPGYDQPIYGGPAHHLRLLWVYVYRDNLDCWIHKYFLCRFGKHMMVENWYPAEEQHWESCLGCKDDRVRKELPWEKDHKFPWTATTTRGTDESPPMDDERTPDDHGS